MYQFEKFYQELIKKHKNKLGKEITFEINDDVFGLIAVVKNGNYIENFTNVYPSELMQAEVKEYTYYKNHYNIKVKVTKHKLETKEHYVGLISKASDRSGDRLVELMEKHQAINLEQITLEQAKQFYEEVIEKFPF